MLRLAPVAAARKAVDEPFGGLPCIGASWLGYPHSAGLETIDYIVVDPYILPSDPRLLIERPFELPETWVLVPPPWGRLSRAMSISL